MVYRRCQANPFFFALLFIAFATSPCSAQCSRCMGIGFTSFLHRAMCLRLVRNACDKWMPLIAFAISTLSALYYKCCCMLNGGYRTRVEFRIAHSCADATISSMHAECTECKVTHRTYGKFFFRMWQTRATRLCLWRAFTKAKRAHTEFGEWDKEIYGRTKNDLCAASRECCRLSCAPLNCCCCGLWNLCSNRNGFVRILLHSAFFTPFTCWLSSVYQLRFVASAAEIKVV